MHAKLVAAVAAAVDELEGGAKLNVTSLAAGLGITPKTFHKWANRYRAEGLAGLQERSRRPHHSPQQVTAAMEDLIVAKRKELLELGVDAGAATIWWHLTEEGADPPSESTVYRVLVRRGQVVPEPKKRPQVSWRRFEASTPNERWQIDATSWELADGIGVEIINIVDDHSRLAVACEAVPTTTSQRAWQAFQLGISRYGVPVGCLSDNGLAFSGRLRGFEVPFEANLRAAGVRAATAAPFHPQTCGKVERFQQTEKRWLRARTSPPATLLALQAELDRFRRYYNLERPHRGIGRITPQQRWESSPAAAASTGPLPPPERWFTAVVDANGVARVARALDIGVGMDHTGQTVHVRMAGTHAWVIADGTILRSLEIDPARRYQPTGRPRGPRRPH